MGLCCGHVVGGLARHSGSRGICRCTTHACSAQRHGGLDHTPALVGHHNSIHSGLGNGGSGAASAVAAAMPGAPALVVSYHPRLALRNWMPSRMPMSAARFAHACKLSAYQRVHRPAYVQGKAAPAARSAKASPAQPVPRCIWFDWLCRCMQGVKAQDLGRTTEVNAWPGEGGAAVVAERQ